MTTPFTLFEVCWEVCNKATGVHSVLASKAPATVELLGDDYIAVGPWLLADTDRDLPFDEEGGMHAFAETCRQAGTPIRIGRWRVPGRPRTILVEFSGLYDRKNEILSALWDEHGVDSISGDWDYVEPVLFGWAAGRVIEAWWDEFLAPHHRRGVVQAHEWLAGAALLYLKSRVPALGTVFTCHGTVLGRTLASLEQTPIEAAVAERAGELATAHGVTAKHSIEGTAVARADVLATVSEPTARELELLHRRGAAAVLACGVDLPSLAKLAAPDAVAGARQALRQLASRFLGCAVDGAALLGTAGRYEFHNKGFDMLLDALAAVNQRRGRGIIAFLMVPAGNSGVRGDVMERLAGDAPADGPAGIATHNLFDEERDPIREHCARLALANDPSDRVKVIHVPVFLGPDDGVFHRSYESVLAAMDLTCFPSYYEPWGLAPQESLAVGVPTVTSDYSGFGRWARGRGLGAEAGIYVLQRDRLPYPEAVLALAAILDDLLARDLGTEPLRATCRATAQQLSWSGLIASYRRVWDMALASVDTRSKAGVTQARRPRREIAVRPLADGRTPRLLPFHVAATLPPRLAALRRLARNFWWTWNHDAAQLFEELSPRAWESCHHNPVALLQQAYAEDLDQRAADADYVARLDAAVRRFDDYMAAAPRRRAATPGAGRLGGALRIAGRGDDAEPSTEHPVAYFSAEYGIHESLPIYSGGLGVLAGDHLKSASDLGLPLIAVGLFYRMGYMAQQLAADGTQLAVDRENDPTALAVQPVCGADGKPLEIALNLPGRDLLLRAWRVAVGRVTLLLLDTDVPQNRPEDRAITRNLYGGGPETRIQQEIVLGRGGVRLLRRLDIHPSVYHMNEGHAAFLSLERVARLVREEGLTFDAARELVRGTTVFTTHTPVPAGHDRFSEDLMRRHFSDAPTWVGLPWERFYALGSAGEAHGEFNMTMLALSFAARVNGVSKVHGAVSRRLLAGFWPGLLEVEVPVEAVTNGIHLPTWTSPQVRALLGGGPEPVRGEDFARDAAALDYERLWRVRCALKRRLLQAAAARLQACFVARGDSPRLLERMLAGLDERALWIGFARRFAPYKRADLMFADPERLRAILDDGERPVRILVAGKAHPRDERGRDIVRAVAARTREPDFCGRVLFLEDYDMHLARMLVQGVDVWLNNPIRPLEASGTSGMKAAANGVLNLSIGDGWWPEAYDGRNGWQIGDGRAYEDQELQNQADAGALYRLLEEEVVPLFFQRDARGLPAAWLDRVAHSLRTIPPVFNTDRMVAEYAERSYRPLGRSYRVLGGEHRAAARRRAEQAARLRRAFPQVAFVSAQVADVTQLRVGEAFEVRADVDLGGLDPEDVAVELVLGHTRHDGELRNLVIVPLHPVGPAEGGRGWSFEGTHTLQRSGRYAHGLRVRARLDGAPGGSVHDLVLWA